MKIFLTIFLLTVVGLAQATTPRHTSVVRAFKHQNPCPATGKIQKSCPGYVVDHVLALGCNGADTVANMQWQTLAESKLKDKWEIRGDATHRPCTIELK